MEMQQIVFCSFHFLYSSHEAQLSLSIRELVTLCLLQQICTNFSNQMFTEFCKREPFFVQSPKYIRKSCKEEQGFHIKMTYLYTVYIKIRLVIVHCFFWFSGFAHHSPDISNPPFNLPSLLSYHDLSFSQTPSFQFLPWLSPTNPQTTLIDCQIWVAKNHVTLRW